MLQLLLILFLASGGTIDRPEFKRSQEVLIEREVFEVNAEEESSEFMSQWSKIAFTQADLITFEIKPRAEEEFFEIITAVSTSIRGAWFINTAQSRDIDFSIIDPSQTVVFERKSKKELNFALDANKHGVYVFKFKNNKIMKTHTISFALSIGNYTNSVLKEEHLAPVEEKLLAVKKNVKDFMVDSQFAQLRQETHFKTLESANRNVLWYSIIESVAVIGVSALQIYYIKKLLDNKRAL